jgi:hypothetical protein
MTGVARSERGRGIALALKEAQIAGAKAAGWKRLRTQNDLANAPMRRVNEKLGYERIGGFRRSVGKDDVVLAQIARTMMPYLGESSGLFLFISAKRATQHGHDRAGPGTSDPAARKRS